MNGLHEITEPDSNEQSPVKYEVTSAIDAGISSSLTTQNQTTPPSPFSNYFELMRTIRIRLDLIENLKKIDGDTFSRAETAAFHGRKTIEAIAFACLVATENGIKNIPKDAKGQWNAEIIFKNLKKKDIQTFPSASTIRFSNREENVNFNVLGTIDHNPGLQLSHSDVISIYQRLHRWLHELNPYVTSSRDAFCNLHESDLWADLSKIDKFMSKHLIQIRGKAFYCSLRDKCDGQIKVISLNGA